ncbi:MAG: CPBP family intramembrane metalloprotease [Solobacterium sp.]|nr:CPBP family intramembrane metalloprotease [Solobacterium sp.]
MPSPQVITTRQARKQINHFGRSLIIYVLVMMLMRYGFDFLSEKYPEVFMGFDPMVVELAMTIVLTILVAVIAFGISSRMLNLNIRDYLRNPRLRSDRVIALICIGIGINLIAVSVSTLFYFFFHTESASFPFLGQFNTNLNIIKNILYVILFVFVKPVCDEYIFRGIIQRQLGHYGRYFGVLGSAVLYALAQLNLVDAVPCFFVGWYLSLITLRYHSIKPAVTVNVCLNLFLWAMNVIPGNYLWLITLFIVLIYISAALFIFQKRVDTGMVRYGATEWKLWKILLTSSTTIILIILFIFNVTVSFR